MYRLSSVILNPNLPASSSSPYLFIPEQYSYEYIKESSRGRDTNQQHQSTVQKGIPKALLSNLLNFYHLSSVSPVDLPHSDASFSKSLNMEGDDHDNIHRLLEDIVVRQK
jgi:hypothetical protein